MSVIILNIHVCVCAWMCVHLHAFWEGLERDIFIWIHLPFPWIANKHVITFVCPPPRPLEHIHHSGFPAVSDLSSKVLHYSVDQCGSAYYSIISSPHFSIKSCLFSSFPCAHIQIYVHKKSMEVSMWKRPGIRKLYNIYENIQKPSATPSKAIKKISRNQQQKRQKTIKHHVCFFCWPGIPIQKRLSPWRDPLAPRARDGRPQLHHKSCSGAWQIFWMLVKHMGKYREIRYKIYKWRFIAGEMIYNIWVNYNNLTVLPHCDDG
jgi:hypothetical protein